MPRTKKTQPIEAPEIQEENVAEEIEQTEAIESTASNTSETKPEDTICFAVVKVDRSKFQCANVRNENNEIIGLVANGSIVMIPSFDKASEKQHIIAYDFNTTEQIEGTILTSLIENM